MKGKILKERSLNGYRERLIKYKNGKYGIEGTPLSKDGIFESEFYVYGGGVGYKDSVFWSRKSAEDFWKDIRKNKDVMDWVLMTLDGGNNKSWNKYWKKDFSKIKRVEKLM